MGMSAAAAPGRPVSAINVTPMIDVLLVLLIIFMVVQAGLQRGVRVQVPPTDPSPAVQRSTDLVLEVLPGPAFRLNSQPVPAARLRATLARVYAGRPRKVLFVKGADGVPYSAVVSAVDVGRAAGVEVVGLVPRQAPER
ncbi:MAG: putative biopolymer transport protein [Gemmatimonadetes bacterium]|nr:putative biopolymer transport protein [Gemmatimonadota bacterium]